MRASLNRLNWLGNQIIRFTEFSFLEQQFGSLVQFVSVLSHSELVFYLIFFWIPESLRKVLKILRASLNRLNWLGNQIIRFIEFSLLEHQFGSLPSFVSVLSHSELVFYLICFFWIPDSQRKVLKIFESLSQPYELVGKPDLPVHWVQFFEMEVWLLCFVCVSS